MATIVLSRSHQARLGRSSNPIDLKAYSLRCKALKLASRERRWLEKDRLADQSDRLSWEDCCKGLQVIELPGTGSSRGGRIVGFRQIAGYDRALPLVKWQSGIVSVSHPSLLVRQQEQLSLF